MRPLYATAPSSFIDLPRPSARRLQVALYFLANYFSDARLAKELFDEATTRFGGAVIFSPEYFRARREQFMYAREFAFALDYFVKHLRVMTEETDAPPALKTILDEFMVRLPGIKDLRDSLHHIEDRARGMRKNQKPLKAQPINTHYIKSGGGLYAVGPNLAGSKIFCTAADGQLVEIDISVAALEQMIATLQQVIDCLPWHEGWPTRYPHNDY